MTELTSTLLSDLLPENTARIVVAYSGGLDSHVLLHFCATHTPFKRKLSAVHIHHGLQSEADGWANHCRKITGQLGIPFQQVSVNAHPDRRQSPEEAARSARYQAWRNLLEAGDVLLLAQHREDQLETVLLQLFRGAGVSGLAAMPASMAFGKGRMIRPLLTIGKHSITAYAQQFGLNWVEDTSNHNDKFDRNFLRNRIIPHLKKRWPALDKTVARSAGHCAGAAAELDKVAEKLLARYSRPLDQSLCLEGLFSLEPGRRSLLMRSWFNALGLPVPGQSTLQTLLDEVANARPDAQPVLHLNDRRICRFQNRLHCIADKTLIPDTIQAWPDNVKVLARNNGYRLRIAPSESGIPVDLWERANVTVRLRQGGEIIRLPGRAGHHALKKLLQEASVPPWIRPVIPLLYFDDRLAVVAGLWVAAPYYCPGGQACYQVFWEPDE